MRMCGCVCVCVCLCACMLVSVRACMRVYVCVCEHVNLCVLVCACVSVRHCHKSIKGAIDEQNCTAQSFSLGRPQYRSPVPCAFTTSIHKARCKGWAFGPTAGQLSAMGGPFSEVARTSSLSHTHTHMGGTLTHAHLHTNMSGPFSEVARTSSLTHTHLHTHSHTHG